MPAVFQAVPPGDGRATPAGQPNNQKAVGAKQKKRKELERIRMGERDQEEKERTRETIEAARSENGGWSRDQLAAWGVPWPPPKGWKQKLIERVRVPESSNQSDER